jgi:hypothetical protein
LWLRWIVPHNAVFLFSFFLYTYYGWNFGIV